MRCGGGDLGERHGDLVGVSPVECDLAIGDMQLRTNAVVLVFHGNSAGGDLAQSFHRIGGAGGGSGEHGWDRMEVVERRLGQRAALGEKRHTAGIPLQGHRPSHSAHLCTEGCRNRTLQETIAKANLHVAREHAHDVLRRDR